MFLHKQLTYIKQNHHRFYFFFVVIIASAFVLSLFLVDARLNSKSQVKAQSNITPLLRVNPTNPRYFTDNTGQAVYLTGAHTWNNLLDQSPTDPPSSLDYSAYLNFLQSHNHNFIRLWKWDLTKSVCGSGPLTYTSPFPYLRTGPGNALDGKPKFNLSQFDQSYFDRLRQRVIDAKARGIYVSIMLFDGYGSQFCEQGLGGHPFNVNNNINGINGDPNGDGKSVEVYTLQDPNITALEEAYVRKVVDTVNNLDNVLYEISNESGANSVQWQYYLIDYIKSYEAGKSLQHPVGMTYPHLGAMNSDLFASNADWISPHPESGQAYDTNPPAATGAKVILSDTDHIFGIGGDATWVWKSFLRGLNPIYMDPYDGSTGDTSIPNEGVRMAMGHTRAQAERMNLNTMTPQNAISSTAYAMVNPGNEYLIYAPSAGTFTVNLSSGAGKTFSVEWINPGTGARTSGVNVAGGSSIQSFTAPFNNSGAVLYLKSAAIPTPTTSPTSTPTPTPPPTPSADYGGYRPHYQGYGANSPGGRGGVVCKVNRLDDPFPVPGQQTGPGEYTGTFRYCVESLTLPRFVIFETSGRIQLSSPIHVTSGFLTVAGQTAPAPGITVTNEPIYIETNNIVLQHFRMRLGDADGYTYPNQSCTLYLQGNLNIVLDHLSLSWGTSTTLCSKSRVVAVLDTLISEGLNQGFQEPGPGAFFAYGTNSTITFARNTFVHVSHRQPIIVSSVRFSGYNNFAYNAYDANAYGPWLYLEGDSPYYESGPIEAVWIGNIAVAGAETDPASMPVMVSIDSTDLPGSQLYLSDNTGPHMTLGNQWGGVVFCPGCVTFGNAATEANLRINTVPTWHSVFNYVIIPNATVKASVLASVGARPLERNTPSVRDAVDYRVLQDAQNSTGVRINSQTDVGGYPVIAQNSRTLTIPSNPNAIAPGQTFRTNIEMWLEGYARALEPVFASSPTPTPTPAPILSPTPTPTLTPTPPPTPPPPTLTPTPDTAPPSTPINLTVTPISSSQINLSWNASTDDVWVTEYRIYRQGVQIATSSINFYSDTGLSPSTIYIYSVAAVDGTGNLSAQSTIVSTTTQSFTAPIPAPASQDLGDLIETIFAWALWLVGLAVFVNFLWAGILWFTAAGRPGPITQAKEKMFNALIGAIILLAAYLILNTVNPDLVKQTFTLPGL